MQYQLTVTIKETGEKQTFGPFDSKYDAFNFRGHGTRDERLIETKVGPFVTSKEDIEAELETLLKSHDWFYAFSDDHGVWRRGVNQWNAIREYESLTDRYQELVDKYSPVLT